MKTVILKFPSTDYFLAMIRREGVTIDQMIERHEQLLKLDEVLTDHEKTEHLNMQEWERETSCGTTHCLAGFAAIQPWFRGKGFKLQGNSPIAFSVLDGTQIGGCACEIFFGPRAMNHMFDTSLPNDWSGLIDRVRQRLEWIKQLKETAN